MRRPSVPQRQVASNEKTPFGRTALKDSGGDDGIPASASADAPPLGLKPSGEFLKTVRRTVFLTEFHLIGSNPFAPKIKLQADFSTCKIIPGGDDGIRTHDPHVANVVLSQLSYIPRNGQDGILLLHLVNVKRIFRLFSLFLTTRTFARSVPPRDEGDDRTAP